MMSKKKVMAAALGAALFSGAAYAVQVNPLGLGDLLIAPSYMIGGSWNTELKVINTDLVNSVVAKVVVHDAVYSGEVLDFLIYLSPGDAWSGTLSCVDAACATQQMVSTDGSIQKLNSENFASITDPAIYTTKTMSSIGYVTVIESSIYAGLVNPVTYTGPGISKAVIRAAFKADGVNNNPTTAALRTPDILTGFVTISNSMNGQSASIPMKALAGYNNMVKQEIGVDSSLGGGRSVATIADIEDALWADKFVVPFAVDSGSSTFVSMTYPTKLTYRYKAGGTVAGISNAQYPFNLGTPGTAAKNFADFVPGTVCVNTTVFDMDEATISGPSYNISPLPTSAPLCTPEHDWLTVGSGLRIDTGSFAKGWATINMVNPQLSSGQTSLSTAPSWSYLGPTVVPTAANLGSVNNPIASSANLGKSGAPGIATYINTKNAQITWHYAPSN